MATHLKAGDKAPAFSGKDQDGRPVKLSDYKGQKLALYFYPEDDTPTCTTQACNLRDSFGDLEKTGIQVLGVSPNSAESHKQFEEKFSLPYRMLADEKHKTIESYGVWGPKQMFAHKYMGLHRTTFLIDEKGIIKKIFLKPRSGQHAQEILKAFGDGN